MSNQPTKMPNVNDSNSTLASTGSSGNPLVIPDIRTTNAVPRRPPPPVVVHNQEGQIYDETRPADWDKQRWK